MSVGGVVFALIFGLAALAVWRLGRKGGGQVRRGHVVLAALAPAFLIVACLAEAGLAQRFGEMRLTLRWVEAHARAAPLRLGGDAAADDLAVEGFGAGLARLEPAGPGVRLARQPPGEREAGQVAVVRPHLVFWRRLDILGARELRPGDAVCPSDCDSDAASWWRLRRDGGLDRVRRADDDFVLVEAGRPAPSRRFLGILPMPVAWTPQQAIHPLPDQRPGEPVAYLFQNGGLGLGLGGARRFIAGAGADARLARRAAEAWRIEPLTRPVDWSRDLGPEADILMLSPRVNALAPGGAPGGRLAERRGFSISRQEDVVRVRPETPERRVLGTCRRNGDLSMARVLARSDQADAFDAGSVSLALLGGEASAAASGVLPGPDAGACEAFTEARTTRGVVDDDGRAVGLELSRFAFPNEALLTAIAVAAVALAAGLGAAGLGPIAWTLGLTLQLLLALRVLAAISGAAADPALDHERLVVDALAAYAAAPGLVMALGGARAGWPAWAAWLILTAGLAMAAWSTGASPSLAVWLLLAPTIGILAWRLWRSLAPAKTSKAKRKARKAATPRPCDERTGSRLASARKALSDRWDAALLAGAGAMRLALLAIGVKERLVLAISTVYTPALILGFAGLAARAEAALALKDAVERGRRAARLGLAYLTGFLVLLVALPYAASDTGYVLTVFAPFALLGCRQLWLMRAARHEGTLGRRLALLAGWGGPTALLGVAGAALVVLALVARPPSDAELAAAADPSRGPEAALAILEGEQVSDNLARLWMIADPERLALSGEESGETLGTLAVHLSDYTRPSLGRGWLSPANLGPIVSDTHLSDNAAAVHLMSPFGRVSAAVLLALLAVVWVSSARLSRPAAGPSDARRLAGLLALGVLLSTAAYVILANLLIVPFTGRNVFLLAADSGSDLIEGLGLIVLALVTLRERGP